MTLTHRKLLKLIFGSCTLIVEYTYMYIYIGIRNCQFCKFMNTLEIFGNRS